MKFIHISDLHLGKRVNEFSMVEDQKYILTKIIGIIDKEKPNGVLIAGDIYDKTVPPADAVELFDSFLVRLAKRDLQVFVISGNHDSPERIAFGSRLMNQSGIHMSPVYDGQIQPVSLEDEHGRIDIYMLPFLKPAHVRRFYPEDEIVSYTDALRIAVGHMEINKENRNILITHQFVTGAQRSDSEEISVGGSDNVDASVFEDFDYVALGHIHRPQNISTDTIRYSGTPLKYSFSEANHHKSVTVVEVREKNDIAVRTEKLSPKRDLREIRGTYMELTDKSSYEGSSTDDYLSVTLTDEDDIPNAMNNLRMIYPNLMKLEYDNKRTRGNIQLEHINKLENKTPLQLFSEFYEKQNSRPVSEEQREFLQGMIEKIWEDEG